MKPFRRFVVTGDYFNRAARGYDPHYRAVRSRAEIQHATRVGRFNERLHVAALVFLLPPTCWALLAGRYRLTAGLLVVNTLCNGYPILPQGYPRARLDAIERR